jgi:hypothetical protein
MPPKKKSPPGRGKGRGKGAYPREGGPRSQGPSSVQAIQQVATTVQSFRTVGGRTGFGQCYLQPEPFTLRVQAGDANYLERLIQMPDGKLALITSLRVRSQDGENIGVLERLPGSPPPLLVFPAASSGQRQSELKLSFGAQFFLSQKLQEIAASLGYQVYPKDWLGGGIPVGLLRTLLRECLPLANEPTNRVFVLTGQVMSVRIAGNLPEHIARVADYGRRANPPSDLRQAGIGSGGRERPSLPAAPN